MKKVRAYIERIFQRGAQRLARSCVAYCMAPRIVSIIGSRPEIVQAAPLALAFSDCVEEILVHTGQHYDPGMSDLQIADLRAAAARVQPRRRLAAQRDGVAVAEERIARVIESDAARRGSGSRRHQRDDRRRPRRRRRRGAAAPRRGGSAQLPRRHARGAQPDRDRPALRPSLRPLRARPRRPRRRGRARGRARHRRRPRRRPAGHPQPPAGGRRGGRVRARHRPPQLQHRLAPSGSAPCSTASRPPSAG